MKNASTVINMRNSAIIWSSVGLVAFVAAWWFYGFFGSTSAPIVQKIEGLRESVSIMHREGIITNKKWDDLDEKEQSIERWETMKKLVPTLQKIVGTGAQAGKNISTMKDISKKIGKESYTNWLEKSWTGDAETSLYKAQADIAEVIPVFTGISELSSTKNIAGKITLKSLNDYIQENIVDKYGLANAFGQIGINRVKFLTEATDIGVYEIPLRFERVPNENVVNMLKFLGKTGGVRITKTGKNITLEHITPQPIKTEDGQSTLKNLLITVKEMTISPVKLENQETKTVHISTKTKGMWDVNLTLQFYIRGVSRDYISTLDTTLISLLGKGGKDSLIIQGNKLLGECNGCARTAQIQDIINLLGQAKTAYDSIVVEERDPKKNFTPLDILEHRVGLMTTIETLKKKLENLKSIISPST